MSTSKRSGESDFGVAFGSTAVRVAARAGDATVSCGGELDPTSRGMLRSALEAAVEARPETVVVDLSVVTFFDCGSINELVRVHELVRRYGGAFVLRGLSPFGERLLATLGLTHLAETRLHGVPTEHDRLVGPAEAIHRRWATACADHPTMSSPLVIPNALELAERLARAIDLDPSVGTSVPVPTGDGRPGSGVATSTIVVGQLLLLREVVHAWVEQLSPDGLGPERERRVADAMASVVHEVMLATYGSLEEAAFVDSLTGLLNRRAADRDVAEAFARATRAGRPLTVVMVDVNDLKGTNDRLGHAAGDDVLREVAAALVAILRRGDNAYRVGGDEFLLLFPDLASRDVAAVVDRAVVGAGTGFRWGSASLPSPVASAEALVAHADLCLLERRAGRGRPWRRRSRRDETAAMYARDASSSLATRDGS